MDADTDRDAEAFVDHWAETTGKLYGKVRLEFVYLRPPVDVLRQAVPILAKRAADHPDPVWRDRFGEAHDLTAGLVGALDGLAAHGDGAASGPAELLAALDAIRGFGRWKHYHHYNKVDQFIAERLRALCPTARDGLLVAILGEYDFRGRHDAEARKVLLGDRVPGLWAGGDLPPAILASVHDWVAHQETLSPQDADVGAVLAWRAEHGPLPGEVVAPFWRQAARWHTLPNLIATDSAEPVPAEIRDKWGRVSWDVTARLVRLHPDHLLNPGEPWADRVLAELGGYDGDTRDAWAALLRHAATATAAKPAARWTRTAQAHLDELGRVPFNAALLRWLPLVGKPRRIRLVSDLSFRDADQELDPWNRRVLRGLVWMAVFTTPDAELLHALAGLVDVALRHAPAAAPIAANLASAVVSTLAALDGPDATGQLSALAGRVTDRRIRKLLDKALADR